MGQHVGRVVEAVWDTLPNYTSTGNGLVDVGVFPCFGFKTKQFAFTAATNAMKAVILGSLDGGATYPITLVAAFTVATGATPTLQTVTTYVTHIKVQGQPNVGGAHGTMSTAWAGANF